MSNKSDLSRAFSEDGMLKTHVGGQALLEGIMMRGKYNWSIAVRQPDGQIYLEEQDLTSGKKRNKWMTLPLVRGCVALVESLALGFKALETAADHAYDAEGDTYFSLKMAREAGEAGAAEADAAEAAVVNGTETGEAQKPAADIKSEATCGALAGQMTVTETGNETDEADEKKSESILSGPAMIASMALGVVLAIVLFVVLPAFLTNLIVGEYDNHTVLWNIVDGLIRVAVFIFYIWLIGRMSDIKRMFGYHGAEHKTIHCFEHGLPLTPENARSFPRLHVRCGTAFLIMVMIIAIIVFTCIPLNPLISAWGVPDGLPKLLLVMAVRILFIPVIAGVSYEITVKWAGSHPDSALVKVILWPGMMMQYLTTTEPDDEQIECAIEAMKLVLARETVEAQKVAGATE